MKSPAIVLSSVLVAAGLLLASPATASPERDDLAAVRQNPPHSGGGGTPAGTAAPRGGGSSGGAVSSPSGGGTTSGGGGSMSSGGGGSYAGSPRYRGSEGARGNARVGGVGQAVPRESRPRGDRPVTGTAVPRGEVSPPSNLPGYPGYYPPTYYPPGYYPPSYWNPWYGYGYGYGYWGLGAFYYDPFWWGYSPWYGYGAPGYGDRQPSDDQLTGEVKLKVKPKEAEVYVDGYIMGIVDDFDGAFQHLSLRADQPHRIEIRRPGYETLSFEVRVDRDQAVTYRGEMQKALQEQQPIR